MAEEGHLTEVHKNRLLYDADTLDDVRDRLRGQNIPPKATEIKHAVKTTATIYEIRTALEYWFGNRMTYRESERIWSNCEAFDNGEWALDGVEVVYGDSA